MFTDEKVHQKPWHGLFERLLSNWDGRQGSDSDNVESRLPSSVYTNPERYQAEVSTLFRRLPLCLGHVDQLASGSVMARDIAGLPLLLTRDADGEVHVLLNACRHRGARLLAGDAVRHRNSLSCLYHGWTYGLDGQLLNMPRRDAFPTCDPATHGLRKLPSTVRHGLIWTVLDPHSDKQPNVATYLAGLDDDLVELGIGGHRFFRQNSVLRQTNWKLVIDAFVEFYHIKRLHASTIGQFFADTKAAADSVGPHLRMLVARDGFEATRELPPEEWSPRHHASLVHFIFPNSIVVQHPDYISHMVIFPAAIDQSLFVHTVLIPEPPADEKAQAHWDRSFELIDGQVFSSEDLFICEQIQLGLPAMESGEFVLGRFENNVRRFHETIAAALGEIGS
ncbi:MAG TPA: aromatic ring-hydroxylating dioxygenase subunit alpha [Acetobacteraceae bacterium]|nr:aromatic ring-hydroxylating dioxygenase subunit alpha [Acetobacteraceae bacterium]